MSLGDKLIELRKSLHLSQEEVAERLNVTRQTISKWETDQSMPDFDKVMPLCNLYDITPDELFVGKKKEEEKVVVDENEIKKDKKTKCLVLSIFLYFVAFAWLVASVAAFGINAVVAFAITVIICGVATCIIIYSSIMYKVKKEKKKEDSLIKHIDEILSLITVIIYFIISFYTMMWHITWLIFLIYALIMEIIKLVFSLKGDKHE